MSDQKRRRIPFIRYAPADGRHVTTDESAPPTAPSPSGAPSGAPDSSQDASRPLQPVPAQQQEPATPAGLALAQEAVLSRLKQVIDASRALAFDALIASGMANDAALLAVDEIAAAPIHHDAAGGLATPPASTVQRLDLGTLGADQPGHAEFELSGGPGRIETGSDRLRVTPVLFGPGPTRVTLEAAPAPGEVLLASVRAISDAGSIEVPVFARWQAAGGPLTIASASAAVPPRAGAVASTAEPATATPKIVVRTVLVISRVQGFPRALALQRAIEQIGGVVDAKALGFEHNVLNLQVQHDAYVNLAERVTDMPGFPLSVINSSLGRLQLAAEFR